MFKRRKFLSDACFFFLQSPNVFLTLRNGRPLAKVADLGLAEVLPKASKVQGVDNPIWAAVEIIQGGMCTEAVDVWSFAIIVSDLVVAFSFLTIFPLK